MNTFHPLLSLLSRIVLFVLVLLLLQAKKHLKHNIFQKNIIKEHTACPKNI